MISSQRGIWIWSHDKYEIQRRGADVEPPKHWGVEQVAMQEEKDLVLHSRAPGTWVSYTRWWQLFVTAARL